MKEFKAGTMRLRHDYSSFEPEEIDRQWIIDDPVIVNAMSKADRELGRLDMFSEYVPNLDIFIRMHVTKEATQSSKIEDTQTEMEEALLPEDEVIPERRDDWQEVQNYISALNTSITDLEKLPFSNRLLCNAHATLMQGVRGEHKTPGEYRHSQNWIGGSNPGNARFVPPHHEGLHQIMGDLEKFAHNRQYPLPPLVKAAILHYQFETIHPFLDGNGRIGRLMIPLFLISQGVLKQPVLYLSDYLERNRAEYYSRLTAVRENNDITGWLHFFLDGISETADQGGKTFDAILKFQRDWEIAIGSWKSQSTSGLSLFKHLFTQPITSAAGVAKAASISNPTAYRLIDQFTNCGLLREITGAKRGKLYLFQPYLDLFK